LVAKIEIDKGDIFGELKVIKELSSRQVGKHKKRYFKCKCSCGVILTKPMAYLTVNKGSILSCGHDLVPAATTHGLSKEPSFLAWQNMMKRCYGSYENLRYKGRGIRVCKLWRDPPEKFVAWCKNNGWQKGLHLDRIDNDGNYEPKNCRIVTHLQNQYNRENTRKVIYKGKEVAFAELVAKIGKVPNDVAKFRYYHSGWPLMKALTEPVKEYINGRKRK